MIAEKMKRLKTATLLAAALYCILTGCAPMKEFVITSESPFANNGKPVRVEIVIPQFEDDKKQLDKFKNNIEEWFQASRRTRNDSGKLCMFKAGLIPGSLRESTIDYPQSKELYTKNSAEIKVRRPSTDWRKCAEKWGAFIWAYYLFDRQGKMLTSEQITQYGEKAYVSPAQLFGYSPIRVKLTEYGLDVQKTELRRNAWRP